MISVSVPGKVHLMGEHAVVFGKPALLAAINKRLVVTLRETKHALSIVSDEPAVFVHHAVETVCKKLNKSLPRVCLTISSEILPGYHLGSSAATAVGVVGTLYYFFTGKLDLDTINAIAYDVEKKQHGNPSGGDNTAVTFGGLLWYRKETEHIKTFSHLSWAIPESLNHFFLVDTGRPKETTGEMVAAVAKEAGQRKSEVRNYLDENEQQTKRLANALYSKDEKQLVDAIVKGEQTLEGIGVVSKKVLPFIRTVERSGGGAKILGGGGRQDGVGFLLCYHTDKNSAHAVGKKFGFSVCEVQLGEEGLRLEKV